jgi:hypothetical protein
MTGVMEKTQSRHDKATHTDYKGEGNLVTPNCASSISNIEGIALVLFLEFETHT